MKELEKLNPVEKEIVSQIPKQYKLLGSIRSKPGHNIYELDIREIVITKIIPESNIDIKGFKHKKVNTKENCYYCTALNKKNAVKRFRKMFSDHPAITYLFNILNSKYGKTNK